MTTGVSGPEATDTKAPAIALGSGWGPVETFEKQTFRWEGQDAQVTARGSGLARVAVDAEAGPGVAHPSFVLRALGADGKQVDAAEFAGRSTAVFFLPASPGGTTYHLHAEDAIPNAKDHGRVLDYRVFSVVTTRGDLLYPEIVKVPLAVGEGWYPLEIYSGDVFRWVPGRASASVNAPAAKSAQLRVLIEGGPSLGGKPLQLTIAQNGKDLRTVTVRTRTTVALPVSLSAGSNTFTLTSQPAVVPKLNGDPRTLDFRVFSLQLI